MPAQAQADRRTAIQRLLREGPVPNQVDLVEALHEQGFDATQSSVSRDLKELGAIKTAAGYTLAEATDDADVVAEVADLLRGMTPAGPNLLVIKTAIGAAQRVALALDRSGWRDIVGTVAGDDTVFAATPNGQSQRRLAQRVSRGAA
ncbi:MAG: arginine repressor [Pseudomonadota bacterium]